MQENESSHKNLIRHLPADLTSSEAVQELLNDPASTVTAMITAALAAGRKEVVLAGGRLVQAIFKGRTFKQLGQELNDLLEKGKIRKDYADTKYGSQSFVELMTMIDADTPDEDKLRAAKAMFIAVNSATAPEGEAFLRYQLFKIVLKLSGPQCVLLGICNKLRKERVFNESTSRIAQNWLNAVARGMGHQVFLLIEQDEAVLIELKILTPRLQADHSGADLKDARLTELGVRICELIESHNEAAAGDPGTKSFQTNA